MSSWIRGLGEPLSQKETKLVEYVYHTTEEEEGIHEAKRAFFLQGEKLSMAGRQRHLVGRENVLEKEF